MSVSDSSGRTIWIADAHRGDGKRFVLRADEKLTAFMELEMGFASSDSVDQLLARELGVARSDCRLSSQAFISLKLT